MMAAVRTGRARGAAGGGLRGKQWRLPGVAAALVVVLLAVLLPAADARAAGPGDPAFYAEIHNVATLKCVNVRGNSTDAGAHLRHGLSCPRRFRWCSFTAESPSASMFWSL